MRKKSTIFRTKLSSKKVEQLKKISLILILFFVVQFFAGNAYAQTNEISGVVKSASDGTGLPGVSVIEKGTSNGTVTDIDGKYMIKVSSQNAVLIFDFLGYTVQEITVGGSSKIDVTLEQSDKEIDEVVVIGYGTQKKSDVTGAIAVVNSEELTLGGTISNAGQALQGRTAGVMVVQNSKAPGGSISIRIRGSNSISSTNEPLYVVDGFPTSNGTDINPNDIESMQILKDASATAIYGARGANGVILIQTKRGKSGESRISYSGYTGVTKVYNPFDMLDGKQYMTLANDLYREIAGKENIEYGVYSQTQLQSNVNTDWISEATRTGVVQSHSLQFEGGSDKTRILTSLGYFNQDGILKNTSFNRISGRVNVDQTVNKYVKAGANFLASREQSNVQDYGGNILNSNVLLGILTYDPTVPVYNEDGTYGRPPGGRGDNPVANLLSRTNDLMRDKILTNFYLSIEPIKGLTARFNIGQEIVKNTLDTYLPRSTYQGGIDDGVASSSDNSAVHQLADATITYNKQISDHTFTVMGGYSYEKNIGRSKYIGVNGFSTDLFSYNNLGAAANITSVSSGKYENILISFFGRVNYSFKDKYLLTFTLRDDGSSRFGKDYRWGLFPSGSFAWRLGKESFIEDLGIFSDLKFRLGYGKTGNDQIGNYSSFALVSSGVHLTFDGTSNTGGTHLNSGTPENSALKWETTSQYNTGLDFSFFNSRIAITVDAYYKKTEDLLIRREFPLYSGFSSGQANIGSIENKGFEFEITSNNFVQDFKWETRLNFAVNKNKVLSLGGGKDIYLTSSKPMGNVSEEAFAVIREGESLGSLFGYVYEGVIQTGEVYAPQPNSKPGDPKFADISGPAGVPDGKITSDDRKIIGRANPKLIFGLTNTFSYKNFDLSVFLHGSIGNQLLNMTSMNLEWNRTTEALDRWTTSNTNTNTPRNGFYYLKSGGGYINDHFIENASFLRLKNVTLGYNLPIHVKFLQSLRVYASAENLLTFTKYTGWDPEVDTKGYEAKGSQTANAGAGLDFNAYPNMKSYTFGVNITF